MPMSLNFRASRIASIACIALLRTKAAYRTCFQWPTRRRPRSLTTRTVPPGRSIATAGLSRSRAAVRHHSSRFVKRAVPERSVFRKDNRNALFKRHELTMPNLESRQPIVQLHTREPDGPNESKSRFASLHAPATSETQEMRIRYHGARLFQDLAPERLLPILIAFRSASGEIPRDGVFGDDDDVARPRHADAGGTMPLAGRNVRRGMPGLSPTISAAYDLNLGRVGKQGVHRVVLSVTASG